MKHWIAVILLAALSGNSLALAADAQPSEMVRTSLQSARQILEQDRGSMWGKRLDEVPWFFIQDKLVFLTQDPKVAGFEKRGDFWVGALPPSVITANSSLQWADRSWAMILLPLPDDQQQAIQLLIHEAWHVVQPSILSLPKFSDNGKGSSLLDEAEGRIWLRLEWRALAEALRTSGGKQDQAVADALLFRAMRYGKATRDEQERERLLDISEGLAEFTGWKLSKATPAAFATYMTQTVPTIPSYIRSFPYFTGPAYGYLLDQRRPRWIKDLAANLDVQLLLADTLPNKLKPVIALLKEPTHADLGAKAEVTGKNWGLAEIRQDEALRTEQMQKKLAELTALYMKGPTLRLKPKKLSISFNPSRQVSLGDSGTVMPQLVWKNADGAELKAPGGALVSTDWKEVTLPIGGLTIREGVLDKDMEWSGSDWQLKLPKGWLIKNEGQSKIAQPGD